jgi:hypothetical protein
MSAKNALFLFTGFAALQAQAASFPAIPFSHKEWEVVCDNTRTCRAAGYQADDAEYKATILLTRRAGPSESTRVQLRIAETDAGFPVRVQMLIDAHPLGPVKLNDEGIGELSGTQDAALLAALAKESKLS